MRAIGEALKLIVTGGAGFVGSSLAVGLKARHPSWHIVAFDNLRRRGSELALARLRKHGVLFAHGDVRQRSDLSDLDPFDVLIDCSAEPSVLAGLDGCPGYAVDTNLGGTLHCLELARKYEAALIFLSTSRVYPIAEIEKLPFREDETRFELTSATGVPGFSTNGIAEDFPLTGARSIYGATKLCSELMIQEYAATYDMRAVINRCGVLTGPWQMGKVDQGVVMHWVASHIFERPLRYIGYGGLGKQVRDILHVDDLLSIVDSQIATVESLRGDVFNLGGGRACSISLCELTQLCREATGRTTPLGSDAATRRADVRVYLTDHGKATERFGFAPTATPATIVAGIARWVFDHRATLEAVLFP